MDDDGAEEQQQALLLGADGKPHPAWFTPKRLLALFCGLTFLIYLDQGTISSNGVNQQIQARHNAPACFSCCLTACSKNGVHMG